MWTAEFATASSLTCLSPSERAHLEMLRKAAARRHSHHARCQAGQKGKYDKQERHKSACAGSDCSRQRYFGCSGRCQIQAADASWIHSPAAENRQQGARTNTALPYRWLAVSCRLGVSLAISDFKLAVLRATVQRRLSVPVAVRRPVGWAYKDRELFWCNCS